MGITIIIISVQIFMTRIGIRNARLRGMQRAIGVVSIKIVAVYAPST